MTPEERGDLAQRLLPLAAGLACVVHGDGGPDEIRHALVQLDDAERDALIVVLAGLVDPNARLRDVLGYLTWDEHGHRVKPTGATRTLRDIAEDCYGGIDVEELFEDEQRRTVEHLARVGFGPREIAVRTGLNERTVHRMRRVGVAA
ncbi:hypothetical protein [Kitasatospora sp. NPDC087314]|uniref:hypothetical protein n=1 Tax=Kitasatospora sp. NPDC087314 TaxID=3364068 RepID=UPI003809C996